MPCPTNREIERYYFDQFRSHFALPDGQIEYTDKPDVIVHGGERLGIEIANLYLADGGDPTSEQVQRRRREQVLERAQSLHRLSGGRSIELNVAFSYVAPIREIEPLARAIATLGERVEHGTSGVVPDQVFGHIPELTFVYCSSREYADARWRTTQGYSVPLLSLSRVEEVVAEKSKKAAHYQFCDCYWLLIVVDHMDPAQDQFIEWPEGAMLTGSPFRRVLIYKPQYKQLVEARQATS